MMLRLKYGGSGDIKTDALERAQRTIIQCRTSGSSVSIDSNMVMSMINEILSNRTKASEFELDSGTSIDMEDSKFDSTVEKLPPLMVKTWKPAKLDRLNRAKVRPATRKYWLDDGNNRATVAVALVGLICLIAGFLTLML